MSLEVNKIYQGSALEVLNNHTFNFQSTNKNDLSVKILSEIGSK